MRQRRDPLEVLKAQKAEIDARTAKLLEKADPLDQAIAIAKAKQERAENECLGAVVRVLLEGDSRLKTQLALNAKLLFPKSTASQRHLARVLGDLPEPEIQSPKPSDAMHDADAADLGHFKPSRSDAGRPSEMVVDRDG